VDINSCFENYTSEHINVEIRSAIFNLNSYIVSDLKLDKRICFYKRILIKAFNLCYYPKMLGYIRVNTLSMIKHKSESNSYIKDLIKYSFAVHNTFILHGNRKNLQYFSNILYL
jgi:hypothetical protein